MKIRRTIDGWVLTVALALMVLPFGGLYSSISSTKGVSANGDEDVTRLSRAARQLSKETGKLNKKGGFELAAHVLSVHSRIPAYELLARGVKLKDLTTAAMAARITNQSLDYVSGYLSSGATIEELLIRSQVDEQEAVILMTAAFIGVQRNRRNLDGPVLDIDGDGLANSMDPDIDNDGLLNSEDQDIDGDGLPNAADEDIDGDGMDNGRDDDTDGDAIANYDDSDIDADGLVNIEDEDKDGDGVPDVDDGDADGDGIDDRGETDLFPQAKGSGSGDNGNGNTNGNGNGNTNGNGNGDDDDDDDDDDNGNGNGNANGNGNSNANGNGNGNTNGNANGNGNGSQGSGASFKGFVQEMPAQRVGIWRVGGRAVVVTQSTRVKGTVRVGTKVKVTGFFRADGSVEASRIKKKSS